MKSYAPFTDNIYLGLWSQALCSAGPLRWDSTQGEGELLTLLSATVPCTIILGEQVTSAYNFVSCCLFFLAEYYSMIH